MKSILLVSFLAVLSGKPAQASEGKKAVLRHHLETRHLFDAGRASFTSFPLLQSGQFQPTLPEAKKVLEKTSVTKAALFGGAIGATLGFAIKQWTPLGHPDELPRMRGEWGRFLFNRYTLGFGAACAVLVGGIAALGNWTSDVLSPALDFDHRLKQN